MKQTVSKSNFIDAFHNMGRGEQFSHEALELLFDYFEQYESDCDIEIELDVIAICCDYSESTLQEVINNYSIDIDDIDDDDLMDHVIDYLNDNTQVVGVTSDNTLVYQQF